MQLHCLRPRPDRRILHEQPATRFQGFIAQEFESSATACFIPNLISYFSKASAYSNPLARILVSTVHAHHVPAR